MPDLAEIDAWHMTRALALAALGQGYVEPNPLVGCVVAHGAETSGEGWHHRYGEAHAEVEALAIAGARAAGATLYVTLEPCCHQGKTPPCTRAIIAAGIRRVVAAGGDPFPRVSGGGFAELATAGVAVEVGLCQAEAERLNAPYLKLQGTGRPWVIAKWAMTLDGRIASRTGDSRWISGEESRRIVHALRGRVDGIVVGRGTVDTDDPLLTARPAGARIATRIVLDRRASLKSDSQLARTARDVPVLVAAGSESSAEERRRLEAAGCEVFVCLGETPAERFDGLLLELGRRRMTNLLVEGGAQVLGTLFDARAIDEVHVFIAPKLLGGAAAQSPLAGAGLATMAEALHLTDVQVQQVGEDVYLHGRLG